ncbi:hypothetical protein [Neomegalonema sp.]|uniref:hypothetical protein n=1 Tax=Neomegalonema sp. TaxID=2039713 RepID=UPI00261A6C0F|nr:hypothetical protein [Neomegalonema sp.]MDD2868149.1 hypothetical protein [Neomegalonema sp.]
MLRLLLTRAAQAAAAAALVRRAVKGFAPREEAKAKPEPAPESVRPARRRPPPHRAPPPKDAS